MESLRELGLDEGGYLAKLDVNDVLLEAIVVPQCHTDTLTVKLRLHVMRREGRVGLTTGVLLSS